MLQATFLSNNCFEHLTRLIQNSKVSRAQAWGEGPGTQELEGPHVGAEQHPAGGRGWWVACSSVGGPWDGSVPHKERVVLWKDWSCPGPLFLPFPSRKCRGRRTAQLFGCSAYSYPLTTRTPSL